MNARVSVIMAVRNGERHIAEAIESTLSQTYRDFEFLIVDDASDDATPDILDRFAAQENRIRIIRNDKNIGPYPSANRALRRAAGEMIARIDADDRSAPDRLALQVGFLDAHPEHLLVGSSYRSIDAAGKLRFQKINPMDDFALRWTACFRMPMAHPSFCFRARRPDGDPVRYREDGFAAQDYALVGDLLAVGKAACLAKPLVDYRMHDGNISSTRRFEQNRTAEKVAKAVLARTAGNQMAERFTPFFNALYQGEERGPNDLAASAQAFRDLIAEQETPRQQSWMKRRTAGYLVEAFIRQPGGLGWALNLARYAPDFIPPLVLRLFEVKGLLTQDATPGGG